MFRSILTADPRVAVSTRQKASMSLGLKKRKNLSHLTGLAVRYWFCDRPGGVLRAVDALPLHMGQWATHGSYIPRRFLRSSTLISFFP